MTNKPTQQREIKFRAWDFENKVMFNDVAWTHEDLYVDEDILFSVFKGIDSWEFEDLGYILIDDGIYFVENKFKYMQYTCLKDRNGREIYEGDILVTGNVDERYDIWSEDDYGYTVVVWYKDGFACDGKWVYEAEDDDSIFCLKFCRVIGNIYENPNLLENNNEE